MLFVLVLLKLSLNLKFTDGSNITYTMLFY